MHKLRCVSWQRQSYSLSHEAHELCTNILIRRMLGVSYKFQFSMTETHGTNTRSHSLCRPILVCCGLECIQRYVCVFRTNKATKPANTSETREQTTSTHTIPPYSLRRTLRMRFYCEHPATRPPAVCFVVLEDK